VAAVTSITIASDLADGRYRTYQDEAVSLPGEHSRARDTPSPVAAAYAYRKYYRAGKLQLPLQ
jgi:hypothetical protein